MHIWSFRPGGPMAVLQGSTAIVTGASSGIGRAIAHRLGAEGSHVFIAGRSGERLGALAQSIGAAGGKASTGAFDLRDYQKLQAFIAEAADLTGRLDIMVNAAGIDYPGTIVSGELAHWRDMFDTNVIAVL